MPLAQRCLVADSVVRPKSEPQTGSVWRSRAGVVITVVATEYHSGRSGPEPEDPVWFVAYTMAPGEPSIDLWDRDEWAALGAVEIDVAALWRDAIMNSRVLEKLDALVGELRRVASLPAMTASDDGGAEEREAADTLEAQLRNTRSEVAKEFGS